MNGDDNRVFQICIHETIKTASITVKAPNKAIALSAVESTIQEAPNELDFTKTHKYVFTCNEAQS